ncbi:MAG: prepilin-type N-terminal cleavage/methylation domain-containing protein [Akkermansiaceae bacterium]|jgi:prepilin-type N-terminal cleavage/methylation domain-containing protein
MNITSPNRKKNRKGFTLIEVIAVLVLLGILTAVAVPKYIDMATAAKMKAIDAAVSELNSRESLTWGNEQLNGTTIGSTTVSTDLGDGYTLDLSGTKVTKISFQDEWKTVGFTVATGENPGVYAATATSQDQ